MNLPRTRLFGLDFASCTLDEAADALARDAQAGKRAFVVTANVDHLVMLQERADFRQAYGKANYVFADGAPVVVVSKLAKRPLPGRVTGADLLPAMAKRAADVGLRLFFVGGEAGVADAAAQQLATLYPGLQVVGTNSPPWGFEKSTKLSQALVNEVNAAGPHILFVGVGAPKQELWCAAHLDRLKAPVILCTGAAFDFAAGRISRAPRAIRAVGMEWAWRLMWEPRRMWRRYLIQDTKFFPIAVGEIRRARRRREDRAKGL